MEQHPIPKNIMDVEFKLFGNLTIRQFMYVAGAFVLGAFVFMLKLPEILSFPIIGVIAFFGIALSFFEVGGQPFARWLTNFLIVLITPQRKVWKKNPKLPKTLRENFRVPKVVKHTDKEKQRFEYVDNMLEQKMFSINDKLSFEEQKIMNNIDKYISNYNNNGKRDNSSAS
ncbi:PrgI family protein [Candidatus Dojkabacteria bacterium]|nr:PrgI family protein [Candidatus Dojkabacteria bacterium]